MKIDIIGGGNVGSHLFKAFDGKADAVLVPSRTLENLREDSDLYLLAVSDNAIEHTAERVASVIPENAVMAHTSGTTPLNILQPYHKNSGVFYPLQTFSKDVELNYEEIPFFIEGTNAKTLDALETAARLISEHITQADSKTRAELHVASVLACNFVNHLWTLSADYLAEKQLDFNMLLPLIKETTRKISRNSPRASQTGPAIRRDTRTIDRHMQLLSAHPHLREIYSLLSDSIMSS